MTWGREAQVVVGAVARLILSHGNAPGTAGWLLQPFRQQLVGANCECFSVRKNELGVRETSHGTELAFLSVSMSVFVDGMDFVEACIIFILTQQKFF